jgi:hypothetical protein
LTPSFGTLTRMTDKASHISQPGWTGNLGALRIVKAAQRTSSSIDSIDRRSAVNSVCSVSSSCWSLALRVLAPVSVTLRDIETGGVNLAQCQNPWALRRFIANAKVRNTPLRRWYLQ